MSQAQEERRKQAWESHHQPMFDKSFQELRDFKAEIETLPSDSQEYAEKMKQHQQRVDDLKEEYMRLSP